MAPGPDHLHRVSHSETLIVLLPELNALTQYCGVSESVLAGHNSVARVEPDLLLQRSCILHDMSQALVVANKTKWLGCGEQSRWPHGLGRGSRSFGDQVQILLSEDDPKERFVALVANGERSFTAGHPEMGKRT